MIEWKRNIKNCCDDFEVYKDCEYVVVSADGRNHAKMAIFSFKLYAACR